MRLIGYTIHYRITNVSYKSKKHYMAEKQTAVDAEKWIRLIKKYGISTELTAELLNTLIEKNLIHEPVKLPKGLKEQEIEIFSALSENRLTQFYRKRR